MEATKVKPLSEFKGMTPDTIKAMTSGQIRVAVRSGYIVGGDAFYAGIQTLEVVDRLNEKFVCQSDPVEASKNASQYADELRASLIEAGVKLID